MFTAVKASTWASSAGLKCSLQHLDEMSLQRQVSPAKSGHRRFEDPGQGDQEDTIDHGFGS